MFRFPFSSYVANIANERAVQIFKFLDRWIPVGGQQIFYKAEKNKISAQDFRESVQRALEFNEAGEYDKQKFLALLSEAAKILEKEIK